MSNCNLDWVKEAKKKSDGCKGIIARYTESSWFNKKTLRYERKSGYSILKRESCLNCSRCDFVLETMNEDSHEPENFPRNPYVHEEKIWGGDKVKIFVNSVSCDGNGYVDDYEIGIRKVGR